jgi:hypothetical protein
MPPERAVGTNARHCQKEYLLRSRGPSRDGAKHHQRGERPARQGGHHCALKIWFADTGERV